MRGREIIVVLVWKSAVAIEHPSILFIQADDLGIGDVGAYNSFRADDTPNIDGLARRGLLLANYRVMSPVCSPSRAAFMVGMEASVAGFPNIAECDPTQTEIYVDPRGVRRHVSNDVVERLNETWTGMAHVLKRAGYYNAHLGKWHVGCSNLPSPAAYGWDLVRACNADMESLEWTGYGAETWFRWMWEDKHAMNEAMVADAANIFEHQSPFFVSINPLLPHAPLNPRREHMEAVGPKECDLNRFWADGFKWTMSSTQRFLEDPNNDYRITELCVERVYRGSVYSFDAMVGDLLAVLDSRQLTDRTFIIVTSDNGPEIAIPGRHFTRTGRWSQVGSADKFRGFKRSLYEGGVRVPCVISWSPLDKRIAADTVLGIDWIPTFAVVAGVADFWNERRDEERQVGRPLRGLATSADPSRDVLFWEWAYQMAGSCHVKAPRFAALDRDSGLKFLGDFGPDSDGSSRAVLRRAELFNISSDPFEKRDLLQEPQVPTVWIASTVVLARLLDDWVRTLLPVTRGREQLLHNACPRARIYRGGGGGGE
ncbi:hypothetical protein CTAYLR_004070 [Chrysophaeum taylorii]|uniref:Sulfatase N-terminal domain-containing protein n=1 Tax=Chrysophaeum taylorii TaxID=2483200 RepID=A0AAD7UMQ3_9STRA|nr:hypothetical protein CTAYLR_010486 [Chrysophaeum taylorii]KAJ8613018.1 hypothetical protein CTAYLR_004070 [Chrysophaeum taylorii]